MSDSQTVEVKTYSSGDKLGIRLPHPSTSKQAKAAIAKRLGLKPQSLPLFGLFIGPLGHPSKVLPNSQEVPLGADLSFHRWSFNPEKEAKLSRQDDVAMHLLYCEARFYYHHDNTKLKPSPQQVEELESLMDPDFPVERQSMDVMRGVPGYWAYVVQECTMKCDLNSNTCNIPTGTQIQCKLDGEKLAIMSAKGELLIDWPWRVVRKWKMDRGNTIMFEVCLDELNASILRWISLETRQSNYLFHLASDICDRAKELQEKEANPLPEVNPALAGKVQDPLAEFVNGVFRGFTPKFSSIDS